MKGQPVYISAKYINDLRALYQLDADEDVMLGAHFGLHEVIGEYGDSLTIAPVFGQRVETRVPRYAVWMPAERG